MRMVLKFQYMQACQNHKCEFKIYEDDGIIYNDIDMLLHKIQS